VPKSARAKRPLPSGGGLSEDYPSVRTQLNGENRVSLPVEGELREFDEGLLELVLAPAGPVPVMGELGPTVAGCLLRLALVAQIPARASCSAPRRPGGIVGTVLAPMPRISALSLDVRRHASPPSQRDYVLGLLERFHRPARVEEDHAGDFDLGVGTTMRNARPLAATNTSPGCQSGCSVRNAGGSVASPFRSMSRKR